MKNIFKHGERLADIGLRVPQVTQVFLELKRLGADVRTDVYTMDFAKGVAADFLSRKDNPLPDIPKKGIENATQGGEAQ